MSEKQEMIKKLLEMQRKFIEEDQQRGISMQEYFVPSDDSPLKGYREEYMDMAMKVVDKAHEEKGSSR